MNPVFLCGVLSFLPALLAKMKCGEYEIVNNEEKWKLNDK
jgi:hypothetical protein